MSNAIVTGASMARGKSKQDYGTPADFLAAVERRWGKLSVDLAATRENRKASLWLGPGSLIAEDALATTWDGLAGNLWLNPPYSNIAPWAAKCAGTRPREATRIFFLVPASVGANWFAEHVHGKALVLGLQGRLTFEGCDQPYPKDCILAVYGEAPGFDVWKWRDPWARGEAGAEGEA